MSQRSGTPKETAKEFVKTIRLNLLKIGAQVRVSVRRVKVGMISAAPLCHRVRSRPLPIVRRDPLTPPEPTFPGDPSPNP